MSEAGRRQSYPIVSHLAAGCSRLFYVLFLFSLLRISPIIRICLLCVCVYGGGIRFELDAATNQQVGSDRCT